MRIIVCGARAKEDYELLLKTVDDSVEVVLMGNKSLSVTEPIPTSNKNILCTAYKVNVYDDLQVFINKLYDTLYSIINLIDTS